MSEPEDKNETNYNTLNMKNLCYVILLLAVAGCSRSNPEIESLREKVRMGYMQSNINDNRVKTVLSTLKDDGTWPGIDYVDTSRIAFQHVEHLNNMVLMARAYKKEGSELKGDAKLKEAIDSSLDYWLKNDFICENWWNNQIGTPGSMLTMLYVLDDDLTKERQKKMIEIAYRANMNASGARPSGDRVKIAALLAYNELFQRNEKPFIDVLKIIEGEMKFYTKEEESLNAEGRRNPNYFEAGRGLQQDYSFHHRVDRVNNTTTYGLGFLGSYVDFAELLADTKYAFSEETRQLAIDYFLDGVCKQMVYGRSVDPGVLNRDISRSGAGGISGPATAISLRKISDYRKEELENVIKARRGEPFTPESFAKFFWQTEHFVIQRPTYYTSVRMYSTRNRNMEEPYNGEGLTNHFRADGTNYISLDGREYFNLAPVYNFRKIPGATIVQEENMPGERQIQKTGKTDFVGGITDGLVGAVAFDFDSPHNNLTVKKSWFFFDDYYVCLGADINSTDNYPVATTLNQTLLRGKVSVSNGQQTTEQKNGTRTMNNVKWVFHDNIGYIFPKAQNIGLSNQTEKGSWYLVNRQTTTSKREISEDVFGLWINHGVKPANSTYEYIVMPATDIAKVETFVKTSPTQTIANTGKIQAVKSNDVAYSIFYEAGTISLPGNINITTDSPCMLMIKYSGEDIKNLIISDPSRKAEIITLTINKKINVVNAVWNEESKSLKVSIKMPHEDFAGKSGVIL